VAVAIDNASENGFGIYLTTTEIGLQYQWAASAEL
jgi:hypothetical protein